MVRAQSGTGSPASFGGGGLVLGLGEDWRASPAVRDLDEATHGQLQKWIELDEISTKPLKVTQLLTPPGLACRNLLVVGLGDPAKQDAGLAYRAAATAAKVAATSKYRSVMGYVGFAGDDLARRSAVAGSLTGGVGQDTFRREANLHRPDEVHWFDMDAASLDQGTIVADAINLVRRLVNLPPNYLYPESFVDEAIRVAKEAALEIEVWDEARLKEERCQALLAVAQGSVRPPRLCIVRYPGAQPDLPPIGLVGKGVTFDSGGLSIKPTDGMLTMKCDMAGAATVIGILQAASRLRLPHPMIGLVGLVENMISGASYKLGDVLTARSGKTIEIHNTDAEGRLVLADVLDVALGYRPSRLIDFATLTGACVVALGNDVVGVMSNRDTWQEELLAAARRAGEYAWPLPMFSFFNEQIAGKVADIKNVGEGRWGGAITAAKFLEEFVGDTPWIHLDIAGPAFLDAPKSWNDAGGTGVMVRTILELLANATSGDSR